MFKTIFLFEIKRWLKTPAFYIYLAVFFGLALFIMMSALGAFDGATATTTRPTIVNSPLNIAGILNSLATLVYFLLPTIIGAAVYRDYQYNVYQVLFSYPLTKPTYLSAKFLSNLCVVLLIAFSCILGFFVGQYMPNVNKSLLGPNDPWAYLQAFFILIVPNMILFGLVVFAVVNYARNIYVGFIFVLVLFVFQSVFASMSSDLENRYLVALLDPFGFEPLVYYTKYWSIDEQNTLSLPFWGVVLYNRLIWLGVASIVGFLVYRSFSFSQLSHSFGRNKSGKRLTKNNFGSIVRISLPKIDFNYSFLSRLKTSWHLSNVDFKFIVKNWTFIIIMFISVLMVLAVASTIGAIMGTETYPVTWKLLSTISSIYSFFIMILIFLFAGMLIQRARTARMDFLIDTTALPNWVIYFSKFLALVKMTLLILLISMLTGIFYQIFEGYFKFEIGHYITELFGLDMLKYLVLILFALFINSLFRNYFVGFLVCIIINIGLSYLPKIGVEQSVFIFNKDPGYSYSDMNGYGSIREFIYYRIYWILFGIFLSGLTLLFWRRGIEKGIKTSFATFRTRLKPAVITVTVLSMLLFVALGYTIYYQDNIAEKRYSAQEREKMSVDFEKKYKKYQSLPAPRVVDISLNVDLFPIERRYKAKARFLYINKTQEVIDTLFLNHSKDLKSEEFSIPAKCFLRDTVGYVQLFKLEKPLMPGDTLEVKYAMESEKNTFFKDKSDIIANGTFLNNTMFPKLAYDENFEIVDNDIRNKYKLAPKNRLPEPTDPKALENNYISNDADWIDFEATISTSPDQIALAPGYLQKEWVEGDRRYFHYKMDNKILNFFSIISARFEVKKEQYKGVNFEIYYHKGHEFNIDRMMTSMKKSLDYFQDNYSPYQFRQMRVIEFPKTYGTFAQAFANTVPFSEAIGFIAKVNEDDPNAIDYAYSVISHEFAHQWWAHQVIGARAKGATMMSESLAEYSSLKVLEKTYGPQQMRRFLKDALDKYLQGRANERFGENPLMYNENQPYIHYNKGSLVMYAMSDLMGEKNFNAYLSDYLDRFAFQYPPYTTSLDFISGLKEVTPDSLQYAVHDMYESITLYDNRVLNVSSSPEKGGGYTVNIDFQVSKYHSDAKGKKSYKDESGKSIIQNMEKSKIESLPLDDFVEIAIFSEPKKSGQYDVDNPIYLKKIKIDKIKNNLKISVRQRPVEVGIDPYNKLIDTNSEDNRKKI